MNCIGNEPSAKDKFANRATTLANTPLQPFSSVVDMKLRGDDLPVIASSIWFTSVCESGSSPESGYPMYGLSALLGSDCLPSTCWSIADLILATLSAKNALNLLPQMCMDGGA